MFLKVPNFVRKLAKIWSFLLFYALIYLLIARIFTELT
jgi:hypothetical protein